MNVWMIWGSTAEKMTKFHELWSTQERAEASLSAQLQQQGFEQTGRLVEQGVVYLTYRKGECLCGYYIMPQEVKK